MSANLLGRLAIVLATITCGAVLVGAPPAAAADQGYVRLAHLSPDTPAVDVYLSSVAGAIEEQIFPAVGYGVVSDYQALPTGTYAVAMRLAGADPSTPPVLTTQVTVAAGQAYTVAGVGRNADLGLRVIDDDLSMPASGKAKVRIVHASVNAPVLTVSLAGGETIGSDVAFASTIPYREVDPGTWTLELQPAGTAAATTVAATLAEGNVYTCLVLDAADGGLTLTVLLDAQRQGPVPAGGVETGAGGLQRATDPAGIRLGGALLGLGLLAVAAALAVSGRRLARTRRA